MKHIVLALGLLVLTGLLARPAGAIDTVPMPDRPAASTRLYTGVLFHEVSWCGILLP